MKLRGFPGALALGLLASLVAHTALYGSSHEMGGAFHRELVTVALAALGGLLVAFGALAWTGSRHAADGSVLAARLTGRLPGLAPRPRRHRPVLRRRRAPGARARSGGSAGPWSRRSSPRRPLLLALARAAIKALAGAIVAIARPAYATRTPFWLRRAAPVFA